MNVTDWEEAQEQLMPIRTSASCINIVLRWCVKLAQSSSWNLKVFCSKLIGRSLQDGRVNLQSTRSSFVDRIQR